MAGRPGKKQRKKTIDVGRPAPQNQAKPRAERPRAPSRDLRIGYVPSVEGGEAPAIRVAISLPPKDVAKNARAHHHAVARAVASHRAEAMNAAFGARLRLGLDAPAFRKLVVTATWYLAPLRGDGRYRPRDGTNAQDALKAALDGLVDAGLVHDDDDLSVEQMPPTMLRSPEEHGGVRGVELRIEGTGAPTPAMRAAWERREHARASREAGRPAGKGRR